MTNFPSTRFPEPGRTGPFRALSARDYLGAAPSEVAPPDLLPLDIPAVFNKGRFRQMLADRTALKPIETNAPALKPLDLSSAAPMSKLPKAAPKDEHEALTQQAQKWVAQTFFGTLLKQMHEGPFKSHLLDGGRGGEAFQPLMDQHLIERMSRAAGQKLVRGIVRQLEGRAAYRKHQVAIERKTQDSELNPEHPSSFSSQSSVPSPQSFQNPFRNVKIHVAPGF